jgi:hypothetical protein
MEEQTNPEYEIFYDEIKDINGTLIISIPKKICQFAGFNKSDKVKVLIKKIIE